MHAFIHGYALIQGHELIRVLQLYDALREYGVCYYAEGIRLQIIYQNTRETCNENHRHHLHLKSKC